jgi:aerobic-type carbon monoxide dehydrogenase small subunit (CoxS/CutS family)
VSQRIDATVNGRAVDADVPTRMLLGQFLREELQLTGTKLSCGMQVCGVCTVLVDGQPVSSCAYLAVDIDGRVVETVEGLARDGQLHPLQQAFIDTFGLQCGFCTPGFIMSAKALLEENPTPERDEIEEYLDGNLCRCTGYENIVEAVELAAERMNRGPAHA